jgi:hypothetical protein
MTAARDRLFLLRPDWIDQDRPWFCMACAAVEGFLGYYPAVRDRLDIAYLPYQRPRHPVIDLLGEGHQNLPDPDPRRTVRASGPARGRPPGGERSLVRHQRRPDHPGPRGPARGVAAASLRSPRFSVRLAVTEALA